MITTQPLRRAGVRIAIVAVFAFTGLLGASPDASAADQWCAELTVDRLPVPHSVHVEECIPAI